MEKSNLFDKVPELKEKFQKFFQHRKKIAALENFSSGAKFAHKSYLMLVKECLKDGFLSQEEANFLDYMLTRYELNYLDWAHRTKWLKEQMARSVTVSHRFRPYQIMFPFEPKPVTPVQYPVALIAMQQNQAARRV